MMEKTSFNPGKTGMIPWQLTLKIIFVGVVFIILLIPKLMIISLMEERKNTAETAKSEVMEKWSLAQSVRGPVLTIPVTETENDGSDNPTAEVTRLCYFLPESLNIEGKMLPHDRFRSIYKVVVYESEIRIFGTFNLPDTKALQVSASRMDWQKAELSIALSDLRGISNVAELEWNGRKQPFSPGMDKKSLGTNGITLPLSLDPETGFPATFHCVLHLKGSHSLQFAPLGESTTVKLSSTWNDPGFTGSFLPASYTVNAEGFSGEWKILHFNRNYPQAWKGEKFSMTASDFGVELVTIADQYQKNIRSAKYGILVILFVFLSFFLYELISGERIHPIQYALTGFAIPIFYLLLLSISEHLGFNPAYLIASISVLSLVFAYSRSFLKRWINSVLLTLVLAVSFAFIFMLLQMETYALLTGSIGLFLILALTMFLTRKINWYSE
jgi:inner membrane protein